jgi:hypothetical protein
LPSIIVYKNAATPAQVTNFIISVDPTPYEGRPDVKIYHDTTNPTEASVQAFITGKQLKYLKVSGNSVVDYTQGEKDTLDAAELAATIAAAKAAAKTLYDALDQVGRAIRAQGKLTVDELNVIRQWIVDFKAQTALASNLANFQTRVAALPNLPDRTYAQAKTAFQNLVDGE